MHAGEELRADTVTAVRCQWSVGVWVREGCAIQHFSQRTRRGWGSYSDTQERAQDYREMGVETVWIIDPKTRTGRMCSGTEWVESSRLEVKRTPLHVNLPDIFSQLTSA